MESKSQSKQDHSKCIRQRRFIFIHQKIDRYHFTLILFMSEIEPEVKSGLIGTELTNEVFWQKIAENFAENVACYLRPLGL